MSLNPQMKAEIIQLLRAISPLAGSAKPLNKLAQEKFKKLLLEKENALDEDAAWLICNSFANLSFVRRNLVPAYRDFSKSMLMHEYDNALKYPTGKQEIFKILISELSLSKLPSLKIIPLPQFKLLSAHVEVISNENNSSNHNAILSQSFSFEASPLIELQSQLTNPESITSGLYRVNEILPPSFPLNAPSLPELQSQLTYPEITNQTFRNNLTDLMQFSLFNHVKNEDKNADNLVPISDEETKALKN